MRTTIDIKPDHRVALRAIASRRGEKGLSSVLSDAIETYLRAEADRAKQRDTIRSLAGSLSETEATELRRAVRDIRHSWR